MRDSSHRAMSPCLLAILFLAMLGLAGCGSGSSGGGGGNPITVTVTPKQAAVVTSTQTQMFLATVAGGPAGTGTAVKWSVDGVNSGNATVGTIDTGGLYTPPATAGTHTVTATSTADTTKSDTASVAVTDLAGVFTYHNDVARDGVNSQELALTPTTVTSAKFGKVFSCGVDGAAYTQPLWIPALTIGSSVHNVIFVATQHDSVYAFDADASPCVTLWQAKLLDTAHGGTAGETPVPTADVGSGFMDIQPEIGVTGTPVIDPATSTLYVVSKSEDLTSTFHQRLHALDLTSGSEKLSGPKAISASVPGTGDGVQCPSTVTIAFDPRNQHQRPALSLSGGVVYLAWASHEDHTPYYGWIIGYNATSLARVSVFNTVPNGCLAGIWMAGGAPAFDSSGSLYFTTGNGTFDGNSGTAPNHDFGDTVLKLSPGLALADWFTPFNQDILNMNDTDLGSSGVLVLPDQSSPHPHLLLSAGKQGEVYLLDRDPGAMGGFCGLACTSDTNVVQSFSVSSIWGTPAFWQNKMYYGGTNDHLTAFDFSSTTGLFTTPASSHSASMYQFPGPTPSVSAQGASGGVVWAIDASQYGVPSSFGSGPAVLHAYDATNLGNELWNSTQAASNRDQAGNAVKFTVPTVANGKVYIGTRTEIDVYGLLP